MASIAPILARLETIFVKLETVKGTEVTADAPILAADVVIESDTEVEKRNGVGAFAGNTLPGVVQGKNGHCSFKVDLMTTGSQTLNAGLIALVQACAMKNTIGATYKLTGGLANQKTITIDVYRGGVLQTLYGAMGKCKIVGRYGVKITLEFEFFGLYKPIEDAAMIAFSPATRQPIKFGAGAFTLANGSDTPTAMRIASFELDLGNEVVPLPDLAAAADGVLCWWIPDFDPRLKVDPELDNVATYPFESLFQIGTPRAVSFRAADASDRVTLTLPAVQALSLPMGVRDGLRCYNWEGQCISSATGDDSIDLTVAAA